MANQHAHSIKFQAVRIGRLNAAGAPATGVNGSYVSNAVIMLSWTPEYEAGEETIQKAGDGSLCLSFRDDDTLKRVSLSMEICEPDVQFSEIISGGSLFTGGGDDVGYAPAPIGQIATPNGVSIEGWSKALDNNGAPAAVNPSWRWVFPMAKMQLTGERRLENGRTATVFSGWGIGNSAFGTGPAHTWTYTSASPYQYARDTAANTPTGINGYVTVT